MHPNTIFQFEHSYLSLPEIFYSPVRPSIAIKPEIFLLNQGVCNALAISNQSHQAIISALFEHNGAEKTRTFAQAYAGHQFGYFTMLGDGRAIIIGEHITPEGERFDIQLKGSGKTPYSRGGDGKASLKAMLREYLISSAMHYLKIPSSQSLAVFSSTEPVYRETMQEGAVLARVMKSHIRIGTFEYARHFGTADDLRALLQYTINRLYPEIKQSENQALSLIIKVMEQQIALVVSWMRVGFIHGVMNTDNVSISGETFDYGPCAFMNAYKPETVFSSIDTAGRYAFGNQPKIMKWNITRLAEALLPLIHPDSDTAIKIAQDALDSFDTIWYKKFDEMMVHKIGIDQINAESLALVDELLKLMKMLQRDYTNTFFQLLKSLETDHSLQFETELNPWVEKWRNVLKNSGNPDQARLLMGNNNPAVIPRNHRVEEVLEDAVNGNLQPFEKLLEAMASTYRYDDKFQNYMKPPLSDFESKYQTYCGT